jgi:hypothetical protein
VSALIKIARLVVVSPVQIELRKHQGHVKKTNSTRTESIEEFPVRKQKTNNVIFVTTTPISMNTIASFEPLPGKGSGRLCQTHIKRNEPKKVPGSKMRIR